MIGAWQDTDNLLLAVTGDVAGSGGVYPQCVEWNFGQNARYRGWSIRPLRLRLFVVLRANVDSVTTAAEVAKPHCRVYSDCLHCIDSSVCCCRVTAHTTQIACSKRCINSLNMTGHHSGSSSTRVHPCSVGTKRCQAQLDTQGEA